MYEGCVPEVKGLYVKKSVRDKGTFYRVIEGALEDE